MNKKLLTKIKMIPTKPGVYLFKDKTGLILYIGKAVNLRNRVSSHFKIHRLAQSTDWTRSGNNAIIDQYIHKITDIDWIKTDNEKQALLLENQLIKKYHPRYNIQWRDDKSYFWVSFSNDEWPRVTITHKPQVMRHSVMVTNPVSSSGKVERQNLGPERSRQTLNDTGIVSDKHFTNLAIGPFVNGRELRQLLHALRKMFSYRTCKNPYNKPCLQWHLGICPAHKIILSPEQAPPAGGARRRPDPSTPSRFAKLHSRNKNVYISSLNALSQFLRLYAGDPIRIEAYDISNIQGRHAVGSMTVFYGDKPSKSDYRKFRIKTVRGANDVAMLKEILRRRFNHQEWPAPDLILIDGGQAQLNAAKFIISHSGFSIPTVALAKKEEELYAEFSRKSLKINELPLSLRLTFQQVRDEAHRFAIFYYRYLHEKQEFRKSSKKNRKNSLRQRKTEKR